MADNKFFNITNILPPENFEIIKNFILDNGQKMTYCQMYNNNPFYKFSHFNVYLNPDIGQQNINCDPSVSDFNEIVIQNFDDKVSIYYDIKILRKGDNIKKNLYKEYNLEENCTYFNNCYSEPEGTATQMLKNLQNIYLKEMFSEMKSKKK